MLVSHVRWIEKVAATFVQESALYRWLTTEPDTEIIVIDLRETWTVGPLITLLDRAVEMVAASGESSRFVSVSRYVAVQVRETPFRVNEGLAHVVGAAAVATALAGGKVRLEGLLVGVLTLALGVLGVRDDRSIAMLRETRVGALLERGGATVNQALKPPTPPPERTPDTRVTEPGELDMVADNRADRRAADRAAALESILAVNGE